MKKTAKSVLKKFINHIKSASKALDKMEANKKHAD